MLTEQQMAECVDAGCRAYVSNGEPESARWPDDYDEDEQTQFRMDMWAGINAFLRAAEARGFKLLRREPTPDMISACERVIITGGFEDRIIPEPRAWFYSMFDAAPGVGDIPQPATGGRDE